MEAQRLRVGQYELETDRRYDRKTHFWVAETAEGKFRCGFDPLGAETSGDIVAIAFEPIGKEVSKDDAFGSLEAAKFVGPLTLPVTGKIVAHNESVLADPGCIQRSPFDNWLVEVEVTDEASLHGLLSDPDDLESWFTSEVESFRTQGALAE